MIWKEVLKRYLWQQREEKMVILEKLVNFPLRKQASENVINSYY